MTDKKENEESWITKDKKQVERIIKTSWNGSLLLFIFGFVGILLKAVLVMEGMNFPSEVDIVLTMCWIGFFFLYITSRYWALVYRLIPEEKDESETKIP